MLDLIRYKNKPADDLRLLVFESKNLREQLLAAFYILRQLHDVDLMVCLDEDGQPRWHQNTRLDDLFEHLDAQAGGYLPDNVTSLHGRAA